MTIDIVDLPIEKLWFSKVFCKRLPEGNVSNIGCLKHGVSKSRFQWAPKRLTTPRRVMWFPGPPSNMTCTTTRNTTDASFGYPLVNIYSSQWEGWHPMYETENKKCLKPPTRNYGKNIPSGKHLQKTKENHYATKMGKIHELNGNFQ